jgi:predicted Zn-dependent protease
MDTDSQALSNLEEIRRLLQVLVYIGLVIASAVAIRTLLYIWATWRQIRSEGFQGRASEKYRDGKLDELAQMCKERLESHPRDVYATYYLGVIAFDRSEYTEAKDYFTQTLALAPTWHAQVSGYLEKISAQHVA